MNRPDPQRRKAMKKAYLAEHGRRSLTRRIVAHPLTWVLAIPLVVTAWRALGLGLTGGELLATLAQDLIVTVLFVLVLTFNPLERPIVYRTLWVAFSAAFLAAEPPSGGLEWFGTIVALLMVGELFPRLHHLVPLVALGLFAAYFIVIGVMAPLMDRDAASEVLAGDNPLNVGGAYLHGALGADRFSVAIQSARWFLAPDAQLGERVAATGALHAAMRERLDAAGLSYLEWDRLSGAVDLQDGGRATVRFRGRVPGYLADEPPTPVGPTVPAQGRLSNAVAVDVSPFEVTFARAEDGRYRVQTFPAAIDFAIARPAP